jgi:MFS family permease
VTPQARQVALIVAAGATGGLSVGKVVIALPVLSDAFGMSLVQASLAISLFVLAAVLVGTVGGMLADRFGQRRVMVLGLLVAAAGSVLGAVSTSAAMLLASRAVESIGFVATVLPGPALLARLVPPRRLRPVMGLWACYMPFGMAVMLVLGPWLLGTIGWRAIWILIALLSIAVAGLLLRFVLSDPASAPDAPPVRALALVRQTIASVRPWLLAASFGFYAGQWMSVFGFLPTLYAQEGVPATTAGLLTALGVGINVVGNFGAGLLLQRGWQRHVLLIVAAVTMLVGAWLLFGSDAPFGVRFAGVLAFSAAGGLIPGTLFASTPAFAPNASTVSTTAGLMQQGSALGQFVTPPLIAIVVSSAGSWSVTWIVTGAMAAVNVLLALLIRRVARA